MAKLHSGPLIELDCSLIFFLRKSGGQKDEYKVFSVVFPRLPEETTRQSLRAEDRLQKKAVGSFVKATTISSTAVQNELTKTGAEAAV